MCSLRVRFLYPTWSVSTLEEVPRLMRGMVTHAIKGRVPKEQYDRFPRGDHHEKELKEAAGFDRPDDAYLMVVEPGGTIQWRFHGPVSDAAVERLTAAFKP